ncbi:alpha/beta fold hydrolase [Parvibaculum sp. MBR-TMA-1.3b-4.2]|jgi:homoserine O-acetyltransferase
MGAAETSGRERFDLGDFPLESGEVLQGAFLIYRMLGRLSPARDNCILLPSYYSGTDTSYDPIIGPGRALDPERYFIVLTNMFGNGVSASPSTMTNSCAGAGFPKVTIRDNAAAQHRLLSEQFGISKLKLATGWSMGAMQSLHMAALYPDFVERVLAVCGNAKCWPLNQAFLEGVSAALRADAAYEGGRYSAPPETGLRAFGRVYAGWAYSAEFFRERLYEGLGYADLEAFLKGWEDDHLEHHANDLLAVLHAWRHADTGKALADITARTVLMPCDTDTYFTVRETELEAAEIGHAEVKVLHSPYGHCAGAPGRFDTEAREIETEMQRILSD